MCQSGYSCTNIQTAPLNLTDCRWSFICNTLAVMDVQVYCLLLAVVCLNVKHPTEQKWGQTENVWMFLQLTEQPLGGVVVTLVTRVRHRESLQEQVTPESSVWNHFSDWSVLVSRVSFLQCVWTVSTCSTGTVWRYETLWTLFMIAHTILFKGLCLCRTPVYWICEVWKHLTANTTKFVIPWHTAHLYDTFKPSAESTPIPFHLDKPIFNMTAVSAHTHALTGSVWVCG